MNSTKTRLELLISKYKEDKEHLEQGSNPREVGYRNGMSKGSANTLGLVIRDLENVLEGMSDE